MRTASLPASFASASRQRSRRAIPKCCGGKSARFTNPSSAMFSKRLIRTTGRRSSGSWATRSIIRRSRRSTKRSACRSSMRCRTSRSPRRSASWNPTTPSTFWRTSRRRIARRSSIACRFANGFGCGARSNIQRNRPVGACRPSLSRCRPSGPSARPSTTCARRRIYPNPSPRSSSSIRASSCRAPSTSTASCAPSGRRRSKTSCTRRATRFRPRWIRKRRRRSSSNTIFPQPPWWIRTNGWSVFSPSTMSSISCSKRPRRTSSASAASATRKSPIRC